MQESVELPEAVTLASVIMHDVLLVTRLTTPLKPLSAVIAAVELIGDPAFTVTLAGLTVTVKS